MKTSEFEQQFTAWLDGRLSPEHAAKFEQEMRSRGFDPDAERAAAASTAALLRKHSESPSLGNKEFFSHQLLHRMESMSENLFEERTSRFWWGIPRVAWLGAACLLIAAVLFKSTIPTGGGAASDRSTYFATVVDARTFEKSVSATTVYDPQDNVTVLWLDGLDYLPAEYVLQ